MRVCVRERRGGDCVGFRTWASLSDRKWSSDRNVKLIEENWGSPKQTKKQQQKSEENFDETKGAPIEEKRKRKKKNKTL